MRQARGITLMWVGGLCKLGSSSTAEQAAVNRKVVGSNPTSPAQ
jgi:hypothetical protein